MVIDLETLSKDFGKHVKIEWIKRDISQEKLAELAGLHRTTLGTIESGNVSPTLDTIARTQDDCPPYVKICYINISSVK